MTMVLVGCGGGSSTTTGSARFVVAWPATSGLARAGIAEANSLVIEIDGRRNMLQRPDTTIFIADITAGTQHFSAKAYASTDGTGTVLCMADGWVAIAEGQIAECTLSGDSTSITQLIAGRNGAVTSLTLEVGKTVQLYATALNAQQQPVLIAPDAFTWQTSATTVATVTNGLVTGYDVGTARITVQYHEYATQVDLLVVSSTATALTGTLFFEMTTGDNAQTEVYRKAFASGSATKIIAGTSEKYPVVKSDGSKLAFVSRRNDYNTDIYTANLDGTNQTALTHLDWRHAAIGDVVHIQNLSYFGSRIYFDCLVKTATGSTQQLGYINDDGTDFTVLPIHGFDLAIPEDKRCVYYTRYSGNRTALFTSALDGSGETPVTNSVYSEYAPVLSPDGRYLAYFSSTDGVRTALFVRRTDGSSVLSVPLQRATIYGGSAAFSPDNATIAFTDSTAPGSTSQGIYTMRVDGSARQLAYALPGSVETLWWTP
jgi:Tol biopolymer transport system component